MIFDENTSTSFGEKLKHIRKKNKISLEKLALAVGLTKATLSRYENGIIIPNLESARILAEYLGISIDWLVGLKEEDDNKNMISYENSILTKYINIIKKAAGNNITPAQLERAIDFMLTVRNFK